MEILAWFNYIVMIAMVVMATYTYKDRDFGWFSIFAALAVLNGILFVTTLTMEG